MIKLDSPFPWFGGKRKVAAEVWSRFGEVKNYVEPFFGSGAVLFGRPSPFNLETINDLDGYVANFWRSIKNNPEETARWADNPVFENDLHARHVWLVKRAEILREQLEGDPNWYDPQIAGWWVWGISCWIGSGFCSGNGPWWPDDTGRFVNFRDSVEGVNRKRIHLGDNGMGVNRQRIHLGDNGMGVNRDQSRLYPWFRSLADRLQRVRVCSGDWSRVCGPSVTFKHGMTGIFFDPPYADTAHRDSDLYRKDSLSVAHDVRNWCIANGDNTLLRIALCGYEGEHEMPDSWSIYKWKATEGYSVNDENSRKERIWFSPACMSQRQKELF